MLQQLELFSLGYNIDFFKKPSRKLAYFIGFHMADGYISKNFRTLEITLQQRDESILRYFQSLVGGSIVYKDEINKRNNKTYHKSRFLISNKEICDILLSEYKVPQQKTGNEIIPVQFQNELLPDFLRGYFDGDGTVAKNHIECSICCANYDFLLFLRNYYNIGTITTDTKNRNIPLNRWIMCSYNAIKFKNIIYNNEPFALQRKKDRFLKFDESQIQRFKDDDIKFIISNFNYMQLKEIAKKLNRTPAVISQKCRAMGLKKKSVCKFTKEEQKFIRENFTTMPVLEIATKLNRSDKSIYHQINRLGLRG